MHAALLCLAVSLFSTVVNAELPPPTANPELIPSGSLVIAMDNDKQNIDSPFNLKAYGLVNHLLWNSVPIKWAIRSGKFKDEIDFTVNAERILPTTTSENTLDFRAGPFIVHRDNVATALPLIIAFGNNVAVFETTADVTVDIRQTITQRKKVGVLDDGDNADIHTGILEAAGFTLGTHYVVIPAATLATVNANVCITMVSEPHWVTTDNDTETEAIRSFVEGGGNFMAQCAAVVSYENNATHGLFQTTNGYVRDRRNDGFNYPNADLEYNQFESDLRDSGGSIPDYELAAGSAFQNGTHSLINNVGAPSTHVATASRLTGGGGSMVYYLGGHNYSRSNMDDLNGRRIYLNAVMAYSARPSSCGFDFPGTPVADLVMVKSVIAFSDPVSGSSNPKSIPGASMHYTIRVTNVGGGATDADSIVLLDTLPVDMVLFVDDLGAPGTGPALFTDSTPASGITYTFGGLSDTTDDMEFDDGSLTYGYSPTPGPDGYDSTVTAIRVNPSGALNASSSGDPYFEFLFQTKIR
ncbi:MAG: hypothetical protein O7F71_20280 [Gammaproteobacteria bacterium]|nr:hypothetical protein [Gammaproteobacteria bacterium]